MRVVFLDIDGVLNGEDFFSRTAEQRDAMARELPHPADPDFQQKLLETMLDPDAVARLDRLLEETDSYVIVSSTWRLMERAVPIISRALRNAGLKNRRVLDVTPRIPGACRGEEIREWLGLHAPVESFVILDDDSDMVPYMDKLVATWSEKGAGLTDAHVEQAKKILEPQSDQQQEE